MSAKKEKFIPLPPGTRLVREFKSSRGAGMHSMCIVRREREEIHRYERGWYYLTECRIKPDQIGPGKTWEIDE
jgi:hypothetical protein